MTSPCYINQVVGEYEAHHAGILKDDIIFQCDGIRIKGVMEVHQPQPYLLLVVCNCVWSVLNNP